MKFPPTLSTSPSSRGSLEDQKKQDFSRNQDRFKRGKTAPADSSDEEERGALFEDAAGSPQNSPVSKDFMDVRETGTWGKISKMEIFVVVGILVLIAGGATVGILVWKLAGGDGESPSASSPQMETPLSPQEKLSILQNSVNGESGVPELTQSIPVSLAGVSEGFSSSDPWVRAIAWSVLQDTAISSHDLMDRTVLATLYYHHNGDNWNKKANWLSPLSPTCEWEGVLCNHAGTEVTELDLAENKLGGTIHPVLSLLDTTEILWLNRNELKGELRGDIFASMASLHILYLQNNQLSGSIPSDIVNNGKIRTLYVYGNDFGGAWPFCPSSGSAPALDYFELDCSKVDCPLDCCSSLENCFT